MVSSITSVSRNVPHFNCILKAEASCTRLPLGDTVCSTIDLFIIHSLIPSGKIKTATWSCWWMMRQNSREETVLVLDFHSGCLWFAVWPWATHLTSMGLGFSHLWSGVLSVWEWGQCEWIDIYDLETEVPSWTTFCDPASVDMSETLCDVHNYGTVNYRNWLWKRCWRACLWKVIFLALLHCGMCVLIDGMLQEPAKCGH